MEDKKMTDFQFTSLTGGGALKINFHQNKF